MGQSPNTNPANNGANKGPLRRVVALVQAGSGVFGRDRVQLECGHMGEAARQARRARCARCKTQENGVHE